LFPWSGLLKITKDEDSDDLQFEIDEESQGLRKTKPCDKGTVHLLNGSLGFLLLRQSFLTVLMGFWHMTIR
jgi:hypothetical protein